MEQQVAEANHILIVASPAYKTRAGYDADPDVGRGVQYEARLIRNLFYRTRPIWADSCQSCFRAAASTTSPRSSPRLPAPCTASRSSRCPERKH
jgi:hypothetical protein